MDRRALDSPTAPGLAASSLMAAVEAAGVRVETSRDFAAFADCYRRLRDLPVTPVVDHERFEVDGFWMAFQDGAGRTVGLQAVRHLGVLPLDLWTELTSQLDLYLPLEGEIDLARSEVVSRVARELTGCCVYHSGFYLLPAMRGRGLAALLIRQAQIMSWRLWRPDLFFGITVPSTSNPAFAESMGYSGFEKEAIVWRNAAGEAALGEGLVWSGRAQMRALTRSPRLGLRDERLAHAAEK